MGILNVTPDSFSDGGAHIDVDSAVAAGAAMRDEGAAIVDVGGESTRPNATAVDTRTELDRVIPVIAGLVEHDVVVSIDTSKPDVAEAAVSAGAVIVNDVTGLGDIRMRELCAASGAGVVIMHMQGDPRTMQDEPAYVDVVVEVGKYLAAQAVLAIEAGIRVESIAIDPGIGFGKTLHHNLELMRHLEALTHFGYPVLVGPSRKGFLGELLEPIRGRTEPRDRDAGTAGAVAAAVLHGAHIIRVHNVSLGVDVATVAMAMVPRRHHDEEIDRT
jgi:dihydropteroate synthase